jgi:hypothetical protein
VKKLFLLLSIIASNIQCADTASFVSPDERYVLDQPIPLEETIVDLGFEHLPKKVKNLADMISRGRLTQDFILFYGPPGTAKTTSARCMGQKLFGDRCHVFAGSDLTGDQFQNSGRKILDINFNPIIRAAALHTQFIVIDEFQKLIKKRKNISEERDGVTTKIWSKMDEMRGAGNIILVGTCNKVNNLPGPVLSRFVEGAHYHFEKSPIALYSRLMRLYLSRSLMPYNITSDKDVQYLVRQFNCEVRKVEQIVREASKIAFARDCESPVIEKADILQALQEYKKAKKSHSISWEKWLKKHERKIQVGTVIGTATAGLVMGGYGLYKQNEWRQQDLDRQKTQREEDIQRQNELQKAQLDQAKSQADEQMKLQKEMEVDRNASMAHYNCLVPSPLRFEYNSASPEVKARVDERQETQWDAIGGTVGVKGKTARRVTQVGVPAATTVGVGAGGTAIAVQMGWITLPAACIIS